MQFAYPGWLLLLVLIPLPLVFERVRPRILWPSFAGFPEARRRRTGRLLLRSFPALLRGLALGALAIALARPQTVGGVIRIAGKGVAIVVALDQSSSMNAADFPADRDTRRISRLEAAKTTFVRFVEGRPDDLIGLVVFANYPDPACPPTLDHRFLIQTAAAVRPARPGDDGTNIGDAIGLSLGALRKTTPSKKVLVLLTDGNDEPAGPHRDPEQMAILARDLGMTLHTIAIGRPGGIVRGTHPETDLPVIAEVEGPNIPFLERLAKITGGRSFVAADADALEEVFQTINALEKSLVQGEILTRYDEHFAPWAALALGLLALDRLLVSGRLRRLP
jgi:Ca-activated chloride channel family protein